MTASNNARHPGEYIKSNVIPKGMPVKKAAELLGVGRPALSNLLNGNAGLSADMVLRLAKAFNVSQEALLQKQAEYDKQQNRHREKSLAVRAYAPSFMDITATQIEAWADKHDARAEVAVLLRKLILSTGTNVSKIDFPAHDNAERMAGTGRLKPIPRPRGFRPGYRAGSSGAIGTRRQRPKWTTRRASSACPPPSATT
jgi:addiction module HigA family antidote